MKEAMEKELVLVVKRMSGIQNSPHNFAERAKKLAACQG